MATVNGRFAIVDVGKGRSCRKKEKPILMSRDAKAMIRSLPQELDGYQQRARRLPLIQCFLCKEKKTILYKINVRNEFEDFLCQ